MDNLKGKVAVVTGSTSGIGLAYARAFAGAGANIVLNGIGAPADVEKTRTAIENDFGVKAIYSPANMAEPIEIANMISFAERTFGSVDVLVNNAGIQHVSPIEDFPAEKWDAVIAINLSSAFHAIRAAVPGMTRRGEVDPAAVISGWLTDAGLNRRPRVLSTSPFLIEGVRPAPARKPVCGLF